jgi:Ca2+-binding EF-hand superfamily protein
MTSISANISQNNYSISESKYKYIIKHIFLVLSFIKENLFKKGFDTIRILGKIFREMGSYDGVSKINKDEFLAGLRDIGILLPKMAAEKLVQHFDQDIDGCVNFQDFLIGIRGQPNDKRQEIIDKAFAKFDKDGSGYIDVRDLK